MTESKARSDEDETNSSLEQPVSRKAQRRSARTLIMLRTRTKQQCKGHKHRAESCMSQYTSGVCSCQRFLSSAAHSSSEEHPDREPAAEISEAASLSSEELPMNTEVQNFSPWQSDGHHEDNERMQKCIGGVCICLVFCAVLTETLGLVIAAKEKRGWTLNSAGYLLGPRRIDHLIQIKEAPSARGREELLGEYGIDSHRTLSDKHGLAGKRDALMEDDIKSGTLRIAEEDIVHTIVDFLSFLKLKDMGALDSLPSSLTSDEFSQP